MATDLEKIISERLIRNVKDNQYDIEVDMIDVIKSYLDLPYFEIYYDDNPYDYSGELRKTSDTNRDHIGATAVN